MKFKTTPHIIDAVQWRGDNFDEIKTLLGDSLLGKENAAKEKTSIRVANHEGTIVSVFISEFVAVIKSEIKVFSAEYFVRNFEPLEEKRTSGGFPESL